MGPPTVRSAVEAERNALHAVITLAFSIDPVARWVAPNPTTFLASMPLFVDAFGCNGLPQGASFVTDGFFGAALWLPPGVEPDGERMDELMMQYIQPPIRDEFIALFGEMATYHPTEPHWYLPMIGVDPAQQNRGYGAALMRHATQIFDRDGAVAYLESSNPRNLSLYERHGFEQLGTIQVGSSPPVYPMLRMPR